MPDAFVWHRSLDRTRKPPPLLRTFQTVFYGVRTDGTFEIPGIGPGPHLLFAGRMPEGRGDPIVDSAAAVAPVRLIVPENAMPRLDLVLRRGVETVIEGEGTAPLGGRVVGIDRTDGTPVWCGEVLGAKPARMRLVPGEYVLRDLDEDGRELRRVPFRVGEEEGVVRVEL